MLVAQVQVAMRVRDAERRIEYRAVRRVGNTLGPVAVDKAQPEIAIGGFREKVLCAVVIEPVCDAVVLVRRVELGVIEVLAIASICCCRKQNVGSVRTVPAV